MRDLEITKLCAEAMGLRVDRRWPAQPVCVLPNKTNYRGRYRYEPLNDDKQAMALVKRFHIYSEFDSDYGWITGEKRVVVVGVNIDLNRAIVECVARMQREVSVRGSDNAMPK